MDDVLKRIDALAPEYAKAKADSYQLQEFKKTQRAMLYGQAVGTEDVYLGLSDRDPSSNHCGSLLVKVTLPNTKISQV